MLVEKNEKGEELRDLGKYEEEKLAQSAIVGGIDDEPEEEKKDGEEEVPVLGG